MPQFPSPLFAPEETLSTMEVICAVYSKRTEPFLLHRFFFQQATHKLKTFKTKASRNYHCYIQKEKTYCNRPEQLLSFASMPCNYNYYDRQDILQQNLSLTTRDTCRPPRSIHTIWSHYRINTETSPFRGYRL